MHSIYSTTPGKKESFGCVTAPSRAWFRWDCHGCTWVARQKHLDYRVDLEVVREVWR